MSLTLQSQAYLTADLPGIGGVVKQRPEDFLVEEQPLYEPSGEGEHLMLFIEKRRQTTTDVLRRVAKIFRVSWHDVGYAGLKDKHAVTRQHMSVHLRDHSEDEKCLARFEFTPFKLLWAERHRNKLCRGHLLGNRFVIYVRTVDPASVVTVKQVLDRLIQTGVPNYVGHQRFGYRQSNHIWGRYLLLRDWQSMLDSMLGRPNERDGPATREGRMAYDRGDYQAALEIWPKQLRHDRQALDALRQGKPAEDVVMSIDRQQREFLISALQSSVFNDVLDRRVREGLMCTLLPGDLAWKHDSRSIFDVDAACADRENSAGGRVERFELSPSGPMWGRQMPRPSGQVLEWEHQVLAGHDVGEEDFRRANHIDAEGSRRSLRVAIKDADVSSGADEFGPYVRLAFALPRGSFATVVLREIMKGRTFEGRP